jgi:hypothetical protein
VTAHYARTRLFLVWISVEAASENVGFLQPRYFVIVLTVSNVEHFCKIPSALYELIQKFFLHVVRTV